MAVLLSLKKLKPKRGIHIRLILDSAVIVHCLNRRGSKTSYINHVLIAIFKLAKKKSWHLSAFHLKGVQNVIADSLSRTTPLESEWFLDTLSFQWVLQKVPDLQVDLFATKRNFKIPAYVSPNVDPLAVATDSLALDWNAWQKIYLFPPFNLLLKTLHKLRSFKGTVALIAPMWPKSNWYPLLLELKFRPMPIPQPVLS